MKKLTFICLIFLLLHHIAFPQVNKVVKNNYQNYFDEVYSTYPQIPRGILEAVSYTNTRFTHIDESFSESCSGMPKVWGVMGLVADGKNYFNSNLNLVSELSGISIVEIKHNPQKNVLAYAIAFNKLMIKYNIKSDNPADYIKILSDLSEIPNTDKDLTNNFAFNSYLYSVFNFLNDKDFAEEYNFELYSIDLKKVFGQNYFILSSKKIQINEFGITDNNGNEYQPDGIMTACPDYNVPHCSWVASPNFSSRSGTAISCVIMHTVQGSYSSCISWFQNPDADASTHYVVRSSDGQLTQMVYESDKAWHVGSGNPYTVGYEHEGFVEQNTWYTPEMYQSSADLTSDICDAYGINKHRMFYRDTLDDGTA